MIQELSIQIFDLYARLFSPGSLRARFAKGAFWSLAANLVSSSLQLATAIVVARLLGPLGFGELGIVASTVQTLGVFAGLGLGLTATKHVAEWRSNEPQRAGRVIGLSSAMAVATSGAVCLLFYLFAPWIASVVLNAPHLTGSLRLGCGLLFFNALMGIQAGTLAGLEAFKMLALVNLTRGLLYLPAAIVGARAFGLFGAVAGMVAGTAFGLVVSQIAVNWECRRAGVPVSWRGAWTERRALWDFSLPASMSTIIVFPVTWLGNTMLVRQPGGYNEMGIFNAGNQWRIAIIFVATIVNQVLLPILTNLYGSRDSEGFKRLLRASLLLMLGMTAAMSIPIVLFSTYIMNMFGPAFTEGHLVLPLLVFAAALSNLASPMGSALSSIGKMWAGVGLNGIWAFVFVLAASQLVSKGALGLGLAYALAYSVHLVTTGVYVLHLGRVHTPEEVALSGKAPLPIE